MPAFSSNETVLLRQDKKIHCLSKADRALLHGWAFREVSEYHQLFQQFFNECHPDGRTPRGFNPLLAFEEWGELQNLPAQQRAITYGPSELVTRFGACSIGGVEFRGVDNRVRRSNRGCQHWLGNFGEIQYIFTARAYSDAQAAPLVTFARVLWFDSLDRKENDFLYRVKKISTATSRAFNRLHGIVSGSNQLSLCSNRYSLLIFFSCHFYAFLFLVEELVQQNISFAQYPAPKNDTFAVIFNPHQLIEAL